MTSRRQKRPRHSRALPALAVAPLLLVLSCKEPVVVEGRQASLEIDVRAATEPDALEGTNDVVSLTLTLVPEDPPRPPVTFHLSVSDGQLEQTSTGDPLEGLNGTKRARLYAWGRDFVGDPLSFGRSAPFAIPEQGTARASIFLARPDELSVLAAPPLARDGATAALLDDGRLLLVGGRDTSGALPEAALYDHATGQVTNLDGMGARMYASGCALSGGRALFAGGQRTDVATNEVLLFDGSDLTLVSGALPEAVYGAALLCFPDDDVAYLVGGHDGSDALASVVELRVSGSDVTVADAGVTLGDARAFAAVAPLDLAQGRSYLLSGGRGAGAALLASAEVLRLDDGQLVRLAPDAGGNPAAMATLDVGRIGHAMVPLSGDAVLVWGGADESGPLADPSPLVFSAVISDPGAFLPVVMSPQPSLVPAVGMTGARLPDGSALLVGGSDVDTPALSFRPNPNQDPAVDDSYRGTLVALPLGAARAGGQAFLQRDDSVLVVGGRGDGMYLDDGAPTALTPAEVYVSCALDGRCLPDP